MVSQHHLAPQKGLVRLGHIQSAQGLKGQVRVHSDTEDPADICTYSPLWDAKGERQFTLHFVRMHKESVICMIDGISNRTEAEALKGMALCVARDKLPDAEDDEFYHADLLGLKVQDLTGHIIGEIRAVQNFGAGDLLDVQLDKNRVSVYVPFTQEIVPEVNIKDGYVRIDPPEGMMDPPKSGSRRRRPPEK